MAYVKGPLLGPYSLAGTLTLHGIASNRSWYCDWLMVAANRKNGAHAPFLQAGLMRWARNAYRLSAFVAKSNAHGGIEYEDAGLLPDGAHMVAMRARDGTMRIHVGGREVRSYRLAPLFAKDDVLYSQLAGEVVKACDRIAGTIRGVTIATHGEPPHPYTGACKSDVRGVRIDAVDVGLAVTGALKPGRKSTFTAACRGFFDAG